jgi:hypothetical protein
MNFTDYLWLKLIVLCVIAFGLGIYAGITGKSIEEVLHGRKHDQQDREGPAPPRN